MRLGIVLAAGMLVLAFAGVAHAGTLSRIDASTLRYDADPGRRTGSSYRPIHKAST